MLYRKVARLGALALALGAAFVNPTAAGAASSARDDRTANDGPAAHLATAGSDNEFSATGTIGASNFASRPFDAVSGAPAESVKLGETDDGRITGFLIATDPEAGPVTYTLAQSPQHGTIQFDDSGVWTYTPDDDFVGADRFYVIMDHPGLQMNLAHVFANSALVPVDISTSRFD